MSTDHKTTAASGHTAAELQRSYGTFSDKVDANYRAFYFEDPPTGERQRALMQLWFTRCGIVPPEKSKKKKK